MNRRNILALASLLAISALLVFYFRQRGTPPATAIPALFLRAPADATSLFYLDLAALRESPFLAQLLLLAPSLGEDPDYRAFVSATGFDYSRDLDRTLIATRPASSAATTVAFADGRFNREKITAFALRSGRLEKRNASEIYVVSWGKPARTISFSFLSPGRIVLASSSVLDPTVAARPLQDLLPEHRERLLRVAGSPLIALVRIDPALENFSLFGFRSRDLSRLLRDARWISLAARPAGDHLKVALEAECVSADAARELARAAETLRLIMRVLLSDARASRQLSPQAAALIHVILRNGEFIQNDQRVQLRFELSADALAAASAPPAAERSSPARPR